MAEKVVVSSLECVELDTPCPPWDRTPNITCQQTSYSATISQKYTLYTDEGANLRLGVQPTVVALDFGRALLTCLLILNTPLDHAPETFFYASSHDLAVPFAVEQVCQENHHPEQP